VESKHTAKLQATVIAMYICICNLGIMVEIDGEGKGGGVQLPQNNTRPPKCPRKTSGLNFNPR